MKFTFESMGHEWLEPGTPNYSQVETPLNTQMERLSDLVTNVRAMKPVCVRNLQCTYALQHV